MFASSQESLRELSERERASLSALRQGTSGRADNGGTEAPISLFILGPSRSGKTTIEKLVSTLHGVKRGYESAIVEKAVRRAFQTAGLLTSSRFERLPAELHGLCREIYLAELARRAGSARVFTNTNPGHINDAALLTAALPNVRFLFVKRNLEDVLLRIYMRYYVQANSYAYDLKTARDHVLCYYEIMDLMAEKFPDLVRIVRYEDMITDPVAVLRVAANLCGLEATGRPVPLLGDDRGCAEPYREHIASALTP
jgi:hypothetical protein